MGVSGLSMAAPIVKPGESMLAEFKPRWQACKEYSLAILDAMPEEDFGFKITPEQWTFSQQFVHIGFVNALYFGLIMDKTDNDVSTTENIMAQDFIMYGPWEDGNKQNTREYLIETFDKCAEDLNKMTEGDLSRDDYKERPEWLAGHSNRDLLIRAIMHTAHHRAQAAMYLRVKDITPPAFTDYNTW